MLLTYTQYQTHLLFIAMFTNFLVISKSSILIVLSIVTFSIMLSQVSYGKSIYKLRMVTVLIGDIERKSKKDCVNMSLERN